MKRGCRDYDVDVSERLALLELDPAIARFIGCLWVDTDSFVAAHRKHRDEAAERAAADLQHPRRGIG